MIKITPGMRLSNKTVMFNNGCIGKIIKATSSGNYGRRKNRKNITLDITDYVEWNTLICPNMANNNFYTVYKDLPEEDITNSCHGYYQVIETIFPK